MSETAYDIIGLEGRGRFGTVYRATGPAGEVALKRAAKGTWPEVERDRAAAGALAGLELELAVLPTQWIARFEDDWAILPWVDGVDLSLFGEPLPTRVALDIAGRVASLLAPLRTKRTELPWPPDLRPQHVRVTPRGEVRVVDLWHGRVDLEDEDRKTWLGPEVLRGREGDGADVYALGALLLHLLGAPPIGTPETHMGRHEIQVSMALDALADRDVPEPVIGLVAAMLAFRARKRPSASEVVAELGELVEDLAGPTLEEWAAEAVSTVDPDPMTDPDSRIGSRVHADEPPAASGGPESTAPEADAAANGSPEPEPDQVETVAPAATKTASVSVFPPADLGGPAREPVAPPVPEALPETEADVPEDLGDTESSDDDERPEPVSTGSVSVPPDELGAADEENPIQGMTPELEAAISSAPVADLGPTPPPEPADLPPAEPEEGLPPWLPMAVGGVLLLLLLGGGAWVMTQGGGQAPSPAPSPAAPAPAPAPAPSPTPAAEPTPAPDAEPAPEPTPDAAPEPQREVEPAPTAETAPAAPAPQPAAPPPRAQVALEGDADSVWLVAADGTRFAAPGPMRRGNYTIRARFGDAPEVTAGTVDVPSSGTVTLSCNSLFARCAVK